MFVATVEDLFSRRMLGFAQSDRHPTAQLATDAINMAAAVRGGAVAGVIFHTDKGSQYAFSASLRQARTITQSMGRVGCALDNAAAESFFSTLHHAAAVGDTWSSIQRSLNQPSTRGQWTPIDTGSLHGRSSMKLMRRVAALASALTIR